MKRANKAKKLNLKKKRIGTLDKPKLDQAAGGRPSYGPACAPK